MNIRQSYQSMIRAFPGGWDAMAAALGFTRAALDNRVYERRGQTISVNEALQMQAFCGQPFFAEAVAIHSGGTFSKLPNVDHVGNEEISEKFHELYEELGELSSEFRDATRAGVLNTRDRKKINDTVDAMHKTMDELRALTFRVYCHDTKHGEVSHA